MSPDWGLLLDASVVPSLVATALMFLLAGWLLRLDAQKRVNRVFALFLLFRGANVALAAFGNAALPDPELAAIFWRTSPFFTIATPFAVAYFVLVHPKPRTVVGRHRYGALVPLLGAAVLEYAFLVDPTLMARLAVAPAGGLCISEAGHLCVVEYGPLILTWGALVGSYALAAGLLARDTVRMDPGPARRSLLLVTFAFLLTGLYDASSEALCTSPNCAAYLGGWIAANSYLIQAMLVPLVLTAAYLLYHTLWGAAGLDDADLRGDARRLAWLLPLPVLSAAALLLVVSGPSYESPLALVVLGAWRLALPLLVVYALVRHQLFDLDVKVKWGIEKGTVVTAFLLVFFLVSEGAEGVIEAVTGAAFGDEVGLALGLVAAGGLTLATGRLDRVARRVAERTMPDARPVDDLAGDERSRFYREQLEIVMMDEEITAKERRLLENLRERLGLDPDVADRMEREVLGGLASEVDVIPAGTAG